jgi:hypothetical protein
LTATRLAHLTGPADRPPTLAPVGLGDYLGGLYGIIVALTGLAMRDDADTSMLMFGWYVPGLRLVSTPNTAVGRRRILGG